MSVVFLSASLIFHVFYVCVCVLFLKESTNDGGGGGLLNVSLVF